MKKRDLSTNDKRDLSITKDLDAFLAEKAEVIRELEQRADASLKRAEEAFIEMGKHLRQVKDRVGHGQWLEWLNDNFSWSDDTAQHYMGAAKVVGKNPSLRFLSLKSLYILATAPQQIIDEIARRIDRGDIPKTQVRHYREVQQIPYTSGESETLQVPDEILERAERETTASLKQNAWKQSAWKQARLPNLPKNQSRSLFHFRALKPQNSTLSLLIRQTPSTAN
jgi:hypothetical protein